MTAEEFAKLYQKQIDDESITPFIDTVGFSIVRNYPKSSLYRNDGRQMFIKVMVRDGIVMYAVDMVAPRREKDVVEYIITEGGEYKRKVTNFFSDFKDAFIFDERILKVVLKSKNQTFTLNEFVEILANDHLTDRLYIKRKLNVLASLVLKILFWLSDKHYENVQASIDKYHFGKQEYPPKEEVKNIEPFFKYFRISKNIIFTILLITFPATVFFGCYWIFGEFSLSNPSVVLLFFLTLFVCEKFSVWLDSDIKEFFGNKKNFIERLHAYQFNNRFDLKIKQK